MATVPMIAPDGSSGDIPRGRADDAVKAGFKRAVVMHSPDGQQGYVPVDRAQEAINKGFKVGQSIQELDKPHENLGVADTIGGMAGKVGQFVKGAITSPSEVLGNPMKAAASTVFNAANAYNHTPQDQYRTPVEPVAMAAGAVAGADTPKLAEAARNKDVGGMLVESTPLLATAAAGPIGRRVIQGVSSLSSIDSTTAAKIKADVAPGAQGTVMPSAAKLPRLAQSGVEDIFRASAPTGKNINFRENLNVAAPDLADIARKVDVAEAKGGIVNPDMRVRATTDAIRAHLDEMYQNERAPQIQRNANVAVNVGTNANSVRGLEYMEATAGDVADSALAKKALDGKQLTVAEADRLAILANQTLKAYERLAPEAKMQLQSTSPKIGGLKALDQDLSGNLNQVLKDNGEIGLRSYERRYAALSAVRDQLDTRMNATELKQQGMFGAIGQVTRPLTKVFKEGPSGVPSASQAATADVNIGRSLQIGLKKLKASGIGASDSGGGRIITPQNPIDNAGSGGNIPNAGGSSAEIQPTGRSAESAEVFASVQPSAPVAHGAETIVRVPGEAKSYSAKYQIRDLDDVRASHSGVSFQPNPKYALENDRNYANGANQGKVIGNTARFDPSYLITDNPDATNGPMVIDSEGHVLGGNGRAMILERVYRFNKPGAESYKSMLAERAQQFGVDPSAVAKMKRPVLVREIADSEFEVPTQKQNAVTDFNKKGTAELTPSERAIVDSRRVSQKTLDNLAGRLADKGENATLSDVLRDPSSTEIVDRLIDEGVISPQERAAYASKSGLTEAGKDRIGKLVVGRFFKDSAQLDSVAPSVRGKLERIAAPAAKLTGEWDLEPTIKQAIDLLDDARIHNARNLDDVLRQQGLFGDSKYSPEAIAMARHLQGTSPTVLVKAVQMYARDAADSGRTLLGGDTITQKEAFRDAFDRKR